VTEPGALSLILFYSTAAAFGTKLLPAPDLPATPQDPPQSYGSGERRQVK
jgi:hypothetical protein